MSTFDFTGKRVLVTGASHGIGAAVAGAFALVRRRSRHPLEHQGHLETGKEIADATGRPVAAEVCDITDRAAVRRVVGGLGKLDVLVNNAGLELITPILEPGDEVERRFERIIEINVIGTYYVTREAVKSMAGRRPHHPDRLGLGQDRAPPSSPPMSPPSTPTSASCACWRRSWGRAASPSMRSARAG